MPGLILEGGTFRTVFTMGVLDALLENNILFPYAIGISAGAGYGISYQSLQKGRNAEIMRKYRNDKRYVGFGNFFKCRCLFGLEFAFDEVPRHLVPYDIETARKNPAKFMVGVTNAHTGKTEYLDSDEMELDCMMIRATCAIPLMFPAIEINGNKYYDGGLSDPIPVKESIRNGHEKNLIVMTRPKGYKKENDKGAKLAKLLLKRKYPKLVEAISKRADLYNDTVEYCEQLEREGKAVILRPEYPLKSFEKDINVIERSMKHGFDMAEANLGRIKELFK